ncbi:MAG: hypothetical protein WC047_08290, partial [Kiritimatiellales bacterium]
MRFHISRTLLMAAILAGTAVSVAAEDLDSALEAQKKKTSRRVYSNNALLEDRNLTVPRTQTEEERQVDQKLKEMEAKIDRQVSPSAMTMMPRQAVFVSQPVEDRNWLTAAVLDDSATLVLTNQLEDEWVSRELDRQKELKDQESVLKEKEMTEKLLRERMEFQNRAQELDSLKKYQLSPPKLFGNTDRDSNVPLYVTPRHGTPAPIAAIRLTPKKSTSDPPPLFSPEAARISSALDKNPMRSVQTSLLNPNLGVPARKSSSPFSYGRNDGP